MILRLTKISEQEGFDEKKRFPIQKNEDRLMKLFFEALERSRFERIFNYRCRRCKLNG